MPKHHAIVYVSTSGILALPAELRQTSETVQHRIEDTLRIETVRAMSEAAHRKYTEPQHFVIIADTILAPAQNALLKLIEEPPHNVFFHFVLPTAAFLLPTIRSRVFFMSEEKVALEVYEALRASSVAERLAVIAEKLKHKDVAWMQAVVEGMATETTLSLEAQRARALLAQYFYSSGVSRKMLLEHAALSLPFGQNEKIL